MKLLTICFLLMLTACSQRQEVEVEELQLANSFVEQGNAAIDSNWWHSFNNDQLTLLVEQGLRDNLSLKASDLRLKSSSIDAQIAGADLNPDLRLFANASAPTDDLGTIKSASVGISSSWEIDLWGRLAANEEKAYWQYQGQQALHRARANLVAGNITNAWFGIVSAQEKKQVLATQYQRTQDALIAISRRFALGKSSVTNIWQQQKLLKSIEVQQAKNLTELSLNQQTLALWLGIPTSKLESIDFHLLPTLPETPEMGVPAEALKYRPDIEQALAKIKAANENLSVAISAQYPRITLGANYSTSKNNAQDLFDDWKGNLIASLAMPLFDSGTTKNVVKQRKLELQALIFDYQRVWLEAIASVDQVLINEAQLVKVSKNLISQLDLAKRTEKLTMIKYLNGKADYIELLKAQESILSIEQQVIDANKRLATNRVLLYRELSHGYFIVVDDAEKNDVTNVNISRAKRIKGTQS
ncbi:TolC family protein [Thalassotalea crassostreae]|uniref:TolC family protein n=1 Tax=Thalassotalea crassostreae TaxID=1763536 RepID=UPI00138FC194|nr:TolC family protein [Thalassotalea crassostreae]